MYIYVCLYVCISYLCKVGMVILYLPLKKKIKNTIMLYDPIHTYTITYILLILYTLLLYTACICIFILISIIRYTYVHPYLRPISKTRCGYHYIFYIHTLPTLQFLHITLLHYINRFGMI